MNNPIIIIVHGMGNHTAPDIQTSQRGSFGKEFIEAANKGIGHFKHLKGEKIEDHASIVEIHYNSIFDKLRNELAENGQLISEHISGSKLATIPGVLTSIVNFEKSLDSDDFFYTHWLDVALYKSYLGNVVRLHVAKKLCDTLANYSGRRVHILSHSLGTGVIHDTLHQLYNDHYLEDDGFVDISTVTHKLDSIWMVANVSRLLSTVLPVKDPYKSLVRPSTGKAGVCRTLYNVHHKLDPFTWPYPFSPQKSDKWVSEAVYKKQYADLETKQVTNVDTHSIEQYMEDPLVMGNFINRVLGLDIDAEQFKKAKASYKEKSIEGAGSKIKQAYQEINTGDIGTFKDFFDACNKSYKLIKAMED